MRSYRDEGPAYPIYEVSEFAYITLSEYVGFDDESIIDTPPTSTYPQVGPTAPADGLQLD